MIKIISPDNTVWLEKQALKARLFREKEERKFIRTIKAEQKRYIIEDEKNKKMVILDNYRKNIGKTGVIILDGLSIKIKIIDFKQSFGNYRYLVEPLAGSGKIWVQNITVDN